MLSKHSHHNSGSGAIQQTVLPCDRLRSQPVLADAQFENRLGTQIERSTSAFSAVTELCKTIRAASAFSGHIEHSLRGINISCTIRDSGKSLLSVRADGADYEVRLHLDDNGKQAMLLLYERGTTDKFLSMEFHNQAGKITAAPKEMLLKDSRGHVTQLQILRISENTLKACGSTEYEYYRQSLQESERRNQTSPAWQEKVSNILHIITFGKIGTAIRKNNQPKEPGREYPDSDLFKRLLFANDLLEGGAAALQSFSKKSSGPAHSEN